MKILSLKFYEGDNVKFIKNIVKIEVTNASEEEIKDYIKAYLRVCYFIGFNEKFIDVDYYKEKQYIWVSYNQEEPCKYILMNILSKELDENLVAGKASLLLKQGLLNNLSKEMKERGIPVINLSEDLVQIGYGNKSQVVGYDYQSFEANDKVKLTENRKTLFQLLRYNHLPKVKSKVIYNTSDLKEISEYILPISIRSINKGKFNDINITKYDELHQVLHNMIEIYSRVFLQEAEIKYRVFCYKGRVQLAYAINNKETTEFIYTKIQPSYDMKTLCEKIYKCLPICFMCIDFQDNNELAVNDVNSIFSIQNDLKPIEKDVVKFLADSIEKMGIRSIPIIAITGTNGKTTTARLTHHILNSLMYRTALTSTGGIYIGNKKLKSGDTTGYISARDVLTNKEVEVAIIETARGGIIKNGLGYEKASVGVITSISEDHIGMDGIKTVEDLVKIKAVVLHDIKENGKIVVKAQENIVKFIKENNIASNKNICGFSLDKNQCIDEIINMGGDALYVKDNFIFYYKRGEEIPLVNIKDIIFAHGGFSKSNILNVMAAIASVDSLDIDLNRVVDIICKCECDLQLNPGRQNMLHINSYKIILDYGHNSEAFKEVFNIANNTKPKKITGIITAPGDRLDRYIIELGAIAAEYCDSIIIREQDDLRGRKHGETCQLLEQGALSHKFMSDKIKIIFKEEEAISYAMKNAIEGEVIVLFTQCLDVIVPVINEYLRNEGIETIGEGLDFSH